MVSVSWLLVRDERGAANAEYALLAALVVIAGYCICGALRLQIASVFASGATR